jgi:hypothetical protein
LAKILRWSKLIFEFEGNWCWDGAGRIASKILVQFEKVLRALHVNPNKYRRSPNKCSLKRCSGLSMPIQTNAGCHQTVDSTSKQYFGHCAIVSSRILTGLIDGVPVVPKNLVAHILA